MLGDFATREAIDVDFRPSDALASWRHTHEIAAVRADDFAALVKADAVKWKRIVRESGIRFD